MLTTEFSSQSFGRPAPGFDAPLEMLEACHDRIEDRLQTLEDLVAHLAACGCDDEARSESRRQEKNVRSGQTWPWPAAQMKSCAETKALEKA